MHALAIAFIGGEKNRDEWFRGGILDRADGHALALDDVLAAARRRELPGMVRTGATVADAVAEWLRYAEHDRAVKPSTLTDYRPTGHRIARDWGRSAWRT